MKKGIVYLLSIILLTGGFAGCEKSTDAEVYPDTESMEQYEGDAAVMSETEAMMLFEEIYEINKYLEDGMTMQSGSLERTVFVDGITRIELDTIMLTEASSKRLDQAPEWKLERVSGNNLTLRASDYETVNENGDVIIPQGPGLGYEFNWDYIKNNIVK
jgi:hypothetical protein